MILSPGYRNGFTCFLLPACGRALSCSGALLGGGLRRNFQENFRILAEAKCFITDFFLSSEKRTSSKSGKSRTFGWRGVDAGIGGQFERA
jgi:hypothetical protein